MADEVETTISPQESAPETTVTLLQTEWETAQSEAKDYKDKYLRLLAEMENLRKRMVKERSDQAHYTVANLVCDFLPPLDNLENALTYAHQMSDEVRNWALGFQMVLSQFKEVLTTNGVVPLVSIGELFDPHQHEAVDAVESDTHSPGTIIEEYVRGYKMGSKTIRPARVKVARKPSSVEEASTLTPDADLDEKNLFCNQGD